MTVDLLSVPAGAAASGDSPIGATSCAGHRPGQHFDRRESDRDRVRGQGDPREEVRRIAVQGSDVRWIDRLREDDLAALTEHLSRLDRTDRCNRFGVAMTDRQLADYVCHCNLQRDVVVVLKRGTRIDGVCHLAVCQDPSLRTVAELGISVDATVRRAGWAAAMLRKALRIARRRQVTRLVLHYLRRNVAMAAFVRSLGAAVEEEDEDEVTASLPLAIDRSYRPARWAKRHREPFETIQGAAQDSEHPVPLLDGNAFQRGAA